MQRKRGLEIERSMLSGEKLYLTEAEERELLRWSRDKALTAHVRVCSNKKCSYRGNACQVRKAQLCRMKLDFARHAQGAIPTYDTSIGENGYGAGQFWTPW